MHRRALGTWPFAASTAAEYPTPNRIEFTWPRPLACSRRTPSVAQHVGSHDDIIRLTRYVTGDQQDTAELARRAVFNVVAHNRDDHARNTSYLWTPGDGWHLAPAYDLTHSMGPRPVFAANRPGEHYLDVAGKGTDILRADLIGLHQPAGMAAEVSDMIDAALDAVGTWSALASANGVRDDIIERTAQTLPALTS